MVHMVLLYIVGVCPPEDTRQLKTKRRHSEQRCPLLALLQGVECYYLNRTNKTLPVRQLSCCFPIHDKRLVSHCDRLSLNASSSTTGVWRSGSGSRRMDTFWPMWI